MCCFLTYCSSIFLIYFEKNQGLQAHMFKCARCHICSASNKLVTVKDVLSCDKNVLEIGVIRRQE
jgi:hypothetical protein